MARKRCMALGLVLIVILVGCAGLDESVESDGRDNLGSPVPMPHPPHRDCVFPSKAQDLLFLRSSSDLVLRATVTGPPEVIVPEWDQDEASQTEAQLPGDQTMPQFGAIERYELKINKGLERRMSSIAEPLVVISPGDGTLPLLPAGHYILFLAQSGGTDEKTGAPTYFVVDGMRGVFPIREGRVTLECPNYDDPANPIVATGPKQGRMSADEFSDMLLSVPQPRRGAIPPPTPDAQ